MRTLIILSLLTLVACGGGSSDGNGMQPAPQQPTIPDVTKYLTQDVCDDGMPAMLKGGCATHQQTAADPMPWRRWDWGHSDNSQIEDNYFRNTSRGYGYVNAFSYAPNRAFNAANGDGGDFMVVDGSNVRIDYTQNGILGGGTVAGWWIGPNCGGQGWLLFDSFAPTGRWKSTVAKLAASQTSPNECPKLNSAYTQYRLENSPLQLLVNGLAAPMLNVNMVISEHYVGTSIDNAGFMERVVMAEGIGRVLWEAWAKVPYNPGFTSQCPGIQTWSDPPAPGWTLQDRRCITNYQAFDSAMTGAVFNWPQY